MFHLAEDTIDHLDTVLQGEPDPFILSRYVGLVSVAAVTVYELMIKDIFVTFSTNSTLLK